MQIISKILNLIFSTRFTGILLVVFALAMAIATFIENDFGTETAKALVYSAKWFEIVIVLMAINFIGNIPKYNLVSWEKAPILLLHLALVVIILGAGITKYRGYEALVTIKEKEQTNRILSIDSYFQFQASNHHYAKNYSPLNLKMSKLGFNSINETYEFEDKKIDVNLKEYIPNAKYELLPIDKGDDFLHLVVSEENQRKDFYVKKGTKQNIYGNFISFDTQKTDPRDINIKTTDSILVVSFPEETSYFSMLENKAGNYPKNEYTPLKFKALSEINGMPMVFNTLEENKVLKVTQQKEDPKVKNPESAIVIEISSGNETKEVTLFGGAGYMNPSTHLKLNDLNLKLRYGSKPILLPFNIGLEDFTLERYPGSESPSAYYSDLQIIDKSDTLDYQIFMNNVLDYKGYRFFQSAYLPDESGTILSINHDRWGTIVTYIGYALLALGMSLSLVWNTKLFSFIPKSKMI